MVYVHVVNRAMYGVQYRCIQRYGGENLRKRDHFEERGVDGRIVPTNFVVK
jgi:hypothetical protein